VTVGEAVRRPVSDGPEPGEERVTPLELFFDLVFVFAITQVTALISADTTWRGLARGMLVLAAVWWSWTGYAWLTNAIDPEALRPRLAMFLAMAAMLLVAIATPRAFGEDALLFGCAYFAVRALHLIIFSAATRDDPQVHRAVTLLARRIAIPPLLILGAAFLDGWAQGAVWIVALLLDYVGAARSQDYGFQVAPGHFAERHGLIVIIALGESIIVVGAGAAGTGIGAGKIAAAMLGLVVAAAIWWAYFDVVAPVAERRLRRAQGAERAALARDSYSYIHLLMIAGIVLFSLGAKKTLAHVGDELHAVAAVALCCGCALYLVGHLAFRLRNLGTWNRQRAVATVAFVAVTPLALHIPALATLAIVAAIWVCLTVYETIRLREARARIRGEAAAG
jgi:low temperature requirement protein LtrA